MENLKNKFKRKDRYIDISSVNESERIIETDGIHPKFWFFVNNQKYLAKFDSYKNTSYGEVIYNSLAKQVFDKDSVVEYDFVRNYEQTGVVCKSFLGEGESFLHGADFILKHTRGEENQSLADILLYYGVTNEFNHINFIKRILEEALEGDQERLKESMTNFFKMFVLDSLCENIDRNLRNWGVIIDDKTGKFKRLAPIFDNGHVLGLYGKDSNYSKNYVLHYYENHEYFGYGLKEELISIFKCEDEFYREIIKDVITKVDFDKAIEDVERKIGGKVELHIIDEIGKEFNNDLDMIKKETIEKEEELNKIYEDYKNNIVLSESDQFKVIKTDNKLIKYLINPSLDIQIAAVRENYHNLKYADKDNIKVKKAAIDSSYKALTYFDERDEDILIYALKKEPIALSFVKNYTPRINKEICLLLENNMSYLLFLNETPQEIIDFCKNIKGKKVPSGQCR